MKNFKQYITEHETYTDEHGVTWDDEGHNSIGTGPSNRREKTPAWMARQREHGHSYGSHQPTSAEKIYHKVPFAKKEDAKQEGMRWDSTAKKWYHTSKEKSSKSAFPLHH